jgi:hypothetical protein
LAIYYDNKSRYHWFGSNSLKALKRLTDMAGQGDIRIEDHALEFLGSYYAKHPKKSGLLINRLAMTKQGSQAAALITYQKEDDTFFAATLNVSQSDKLASLLSNYKRNGLGKLRYITAIILLAGTSYFCYATAHWVALAIVPILTALAGFFIHSRLQDRRINKQLTAAVDELKNLPADHQWLGIQISSLSWRNNQMADRLSKLCERRGIGLLTVGKRAQLTLRQEPRNATCRRTDFLAYYAAEISLRKELTDQFMRVA